MAATPKITKQEFLDAISEGVHRAMWQMMTNATSVPCHDFFDSIEDGVRKAIENRNGHAKAS
jgi:hypothetical protein